MALLTMEKIFGLKLDADWAVLSACNTASGDGAGRIAFAYAHPIFWAPFSLAGDGG
jgi:CHAT domain-containing protein